MCLHQLNYIWNSYGTFNYSIYMYYFMYSSLLSKKNQKRSRDEDGDLGHRCLYEDGIRVLELEFVLLRFVKITSLIRGIRTFIWFNWAGIWVSTKGFTGV